MSDKKIWDQYVAMEKERDALRAAVRHESDCVEAAKAEIKALRSELVDLRSSMAFRTSLVGRTEAERDALRAKIAEMERQEPVAWMQSSHLSSFKNRLCGSQSAYVHCSDHQLHPYFKPLYDLPGAQPETGVPDGWKLVPIEPTPEMLCALIDGANQYDSWNEGYRDMLAAAPEATP